MHKVMRNCDKRINGGLYTMDRITSIITSLLIIILYIGQSHQQVVNVAVGKPAQQHTDLTWAQFVWTADKAVDNCLNRTNPDISQCCSASSVEEAQRAENYWRVDLTRQYEVTTVVIFERGDGGDQISGFELYTLENIGSTEEAATIPPPDNDIYNITFSPVKTVREVLIKRPLAPDNIIVLCEVQVFAVCDDGFYGVNCASACGGCFNNDVCDKTTGVCPAGCESGYYGDNCIPCGNCLNDEACDATTGSCPSGCAPGWKGTDDLCATACNNGTFGLNCSETCGQCIDYCNIVDGMCPSGCLPGWKGNMCTQECSNNTYGMGCNMTCGNCMDDQQCHHVNGTCLEGCDAGYQGDLCVDECSNNTYGAKCNMTCGNCLNGEQCHHVDGTCMMGCNSGWTGDTCMNECSNGTYGPNCTETCGNCFQGAQCHHVDGMCENGCDPGFQTEMCKTECNETYFGQNCSEMCFCDNATCNHVTGLCPGPCQPGYFLETCSMTCQNKTYGAGCTNDCGRCANESACDIKNGTCPDGCMPGYLLEDCSKPCDNGSFGVNCTETCGNCLNDEACEVETGSCPSGCSSGWTGEFCSTGCSNGTFGPNCAMRCYCADKVPCNKTTGICPGDCEEGYIGEFCQFDTNRAKDKPAYQSTTLFSFNFNWTASLAVDGNNDQTDPANSMTCSSTTAEALASWWRVDMEQITVMDSVMVYGQLDNETLLSGFLLYLSNSTNFTENAAEYTQTGNYGDGVFTVTLDGVLARYVYITLPYPGQLSICEFRVFGECHDGTFGPECQFICNCAGGVPCNKSSGECPNGDCEPGWEPTTCSQACENNMFGSQCAQSCGQCHNNEACDVVNGTCYNGCDPGWQTVMCSTECGNQTYGQDCSRMCGRCKDGAQCHHIHGNCSEGCAAGYHGATCNDVCGAGKYGENCVNDCGNCANNGICEGTDGACPDGCIDGYQEPQCVAPIKQPDSKDKGEENIGAILGGVFGGLAFLLLVFVCYKLFQRRRKQKDTAGYFTQPSKTYRATEGETDENDLDFQRSQCDGTDGREVRSTS